MREEGGGGGGGGGERVGLREDFESDKQAPREFPQSKNNMVKPYTCFYSQGHARQRGSICYAMNELLVKGREREKC